MVEYWRGMWEQCPTEPFITDVHTFDVPETIEAVVKGLPAHCIGVILVDRGGPRMRDMAEAAAKECGIPIYWEDRVPDFDKDLMRCP